MFNVAKKGNNMSEVITKPNVVINQELSDLQDKILQRLSMNKETGIAEVPKETYEQLLPEGLTKEIVNKVNNYKFNMAAASYYALGETANPVFENNPDLEKVTLKIPMFGESDNISIELDRVKHVVSKNNDGEVVITPTYGHSIVDINEFGDARRKQIIAIKNKLAEDILKTYNK